MLNSCTNKVWFVIELCEPIKITEIELANFELFSNVPKQFRVYSSERYLQSSIGTNWPQKYFIGTFEAANLRTVQKFSITDPIKSESESNTQRSNNSSSSSSPDQQQVLMYAKYVRFEMVSHYGVEHYCPLSLVRIFGTSISDEEEVVEAVVAGGAMGETMGVQENRAQEETLTNQNQEKSSENGTDFLNRLVSEKEKIFSASSQFLSNVISTFWSENFNLPKLFTMFSFNSGTKIFTTNIL